MGFAFIAWLSLSAAFGQPKQDEPKHFSLVTSLKFLHENDADLAGGNDLGFTFGSRLILDVYHEQDPALGDYQFELGNRFYTKTQLGPNKAALRDSRGERYVDFFEEMNFNCQKRFWGEAPPATSGLRAREYFVTCLGVNYRSSDQSDTGSELQEFVHHAAGIRPKPGRQSSRLYNYTQNETEIHRVGLDVGLRQGLLLSVGDHLECDSQCGLKLRSVELEAGSIDFDTQIRFKTGSDLPLERARREPTLALYARFSCSQYLDFENRDTEVAAGIEASIGLGGHARFNCLLEAAQPLEQNFERNYGMGDDDKIFRISFGLSW